MPAKRYNARELEQILLGFQNKVPLNELANGLNRTPYGVALIMVLP